MKLAHGIDEKTLREALSLIHKVAIGESTRAYMSIPADPRRDADLLLSGAIDELIALRAAVSGLRRWPVVLAFAAAMVRKLDQHEPKKGGREGWRNDDPWLLLSRVREEAIELSNAIGKPSVLDEAADVANMAMMVADADGALDDALAANAELLGG